MIPEKYLHETSLLVAGQLGLDFPPGRWKDLERGILMTAHELGIRETTHGITKWLSETNMGSRELDLLSTFLTTGETYFFREKPGLDLFKKHIIPEIIRDRRGKDQYFRIWSAGCCTGEEPYTLAMLIRESIPDIKNWNITLLATDINPNFLKKAQRGIYSSWSFRETPLPLKEKYFKPSGKDWEISPEIKKMVGFSLLNLAEDRYPSIYTNTGAMDLIFCRNVLMYFTVEQIRMVGQRFYQSLTDKGWFIPSAVELNNEYFPDFTVLSLDKGIYYRKIQQPISRISVSGIPAQKHSIRAKQPGSPVSKPDIKTKSWSFPKQELAKTVEKDTSHLKEVKLLFDKGMYIQCIEKVAFLLQDKPEDVSLISLLVRSYANLGQLAEARRWGEKLISIDGVNAMSYYLVATILTEEGDLMPAVSTLKRALYLDPHHLLSHYLMGNILVRLGKRGMADKHFNNVGELLTIFGENDIVPGFEGLTAGRLKEMVNKH